MKRFLIVLTLGLLLTGILGCTALAEKLPGDISGAFGSNTQILANEKVSSDTWLILTRNGNTNAIYCFKLKNSKWKQSFRAVKSVPQGNYGMDMEILSEFQDPASGKAHSGTILMLAKFNETRSYYDQVVYYQLNRNGIWNIITIIDRRSSADTIEVGNDYIEYYTYDGTNQTKVTVKGTIQRDIRYLSLESFPMNAATAKKKLTFAPDMPENSELQATDVQFTGGKKYEVYSGPGKNYIRGAKGKAAVSTNGWIQVFGQENGWLLIQYSIDKNHYRFGYIDAAALPKNTAVNSLGFSRTEAVITSGISVTDDPMYSQTALTLAEQGETVVWLATMGDWAYIEGNGYRGFVPLNKIALKTEAKDDSSFAYRDTNGNAYGLFEIRRMYYDASKKVYAVSGVFERVTEGEDYPYPEYADNGKMFTYNLSADFRANMLDNQFDEIVNTPVSDLYAWYVDAYLGGEAPEGDMVFQYDLPENEQADANVDFWFVTVKITLNQNNEIEYMEYVYVPWG